MRLRKASVCVLLIGACLVCVARTSPLQVKDHETTRTFQSSSSTFGVKTSSQPASSSQRGLFSDVISTNAHVQSGNEKPLSQSFLSANSEDQLSQKSKDVTSPHVSGQVHHEHFSSDSRSESPARQNDDTVFGILPAEPNPQRPGNFGTRIQGRNTQVSCTVKGGCEASVSTFTGGEVGSQFHDSGFGNQQSHQGQPVEFPVQQNEEQSVQSGGVTPKQDVAQQQDEIDQVVEELDQEIREEFGDDFVGNDQYEDRFPNTDLRSFVGEPNIPILDPEFPEDNDPVGFQAENNVADPYQEQDDRSQTSDGFRDSQNPEFFGYIEPQTRSDVAPIGQIPEDVFQEPEEQQTFGGFSEEQYRGGAGDQENFQQRFVPQRQVPNENRDFFQEGGENLFLPERDPIESLRYNVPGSPGDDYPIFYKVPETPFQCNQQQFEAGIYGDTDAQCQVFHFCKETGGMDSFLCPNGTVFNQQFFVCDWWYNYNCSDTPSFYNLNAQLYWDFDSIAPSQILSGTGVGSQEEFYDQADARVAFDGNRPIQTPGVVRNQESVSSDRLPLGGGANQQHSTATRQQVFDSKVVSGHQTSAFAEKRVDASVGGGTNRVTSGTQSQSNRFDFRSTSTSFESSSAGHGPSTQHQESHVSDVDDFSQIPTQPVDFQQQNVPDQTGFVQSQTSDEFSRNDLNQVPIESFGGVASNTATSDESQNDNSNQGFHSSFSDVNAHSQSNTNDAVQQSTFSQQHVEDEPSIVQDQDVQRQEQQGTADFNSNFESSRDISTSFESSHFSQDIQTDFSAGSDNLQDVQKQDTEERDEAGFNAVENAGATSSAGFDSQNFEDQQQVNIDPAFEDPFFKTREVPSSPFPTSVAAVSGVQTTFESTNSNNVQQGVTNKLSTAEEKLSQENLDVQDFNVELPLVRTGGTDSGSQEIQRGSSVFSRNELPIQEAVDVQKTNQDKVDFDEILDGFRTRNIAFMDTNAGSQLTRIGDGINENSQVSLFPDNNIQSAKQDDDDFVQKSFEEISFPQEEAKNSNVDSSRQDTTPVFEQQNIQVQDIFNMMRGLPSASALQKIQNGQTTNQQRLSFRPYGQNATPNLNSNVQGKNDKVFDGQNTQEKVRSNGFIQTPSNLDENNQNQQRLSFRPYGQNINPRLNSNDEGQGQNGNVLANQNVQDSGSKNTHQDVTQRNIEKVIFPDAQQNGERRTNSWRPTQQRGNINVQDFSDQPVQTFIEQSDRRVNQDEFFRGSVNNQGPSNVNHNVPTHSQQVSTRGFQEDRQRGSAPNVNVVQRNQNRLNVKENIQPQFRNSVQFNTGRTNLQVTNKNFGVKGLNVQNQDQGQPGVRNSINENHGQNDRNGGSQFLNQPQDLHARRQIDENFQRNSVSGEVFDQKQQDEFNSRPDFNVQHDFNTRHIPQEQNVDQFNSRPVPQNQNTQLDGRHISQNQNVDTFNSRPVPQNQITQLDGTHKSQNQNVDQFNSRPVPHIQNVQFDGRQIFQEQNVDQFNSRPVPQIQNVQFNGRQIFQEQNVDQFNSRPVPQNQNAQFDGRHISQEQNGDEFNSRPVPQNQNAQLDGRQITQNQNVDQFNSRPVPQIHNVQFDGRQIFQEQNDAQFNSRSASQGENNVHFNSEHAQQVQHDVQFNSRPILQDQNVAQFNLSPEPRNQQARHPSNDNLHLNANVKGFQVQESVREGRSNTNFGQPNGQIHAQKIEASDVRVYSQNDPSSAASSVSYNGWRPIIRQ